jgi:hypothetical protein
MPQNSQSVGMMEYRAFAYIKNLIDVPKEINNGISRHSCRVW